MTKQTQLFEMGKKEKADWNKKVSQLTEETKRDSRFAPLPLKKGRVPF